MPEASVSFEKPTTHILKDGKVVGMTDRVYPVEGPRVIFGDVLVKGDLSGELNYNGTKLRVVRVGSAIGLEVTTRGARGPVWKHVECEVIT